VLYGFFTVNKSKPEESQTHSFEVGSALAPHKNNTTTCGVVENELYWSCDIAALDL
jgi:hypothetical protein